MICEFIHLYINWLCTLDLLHVSVSLVLYYLIKRTCLLAFVRKHQLFWRTPRLNSILMVKGGKFLKNIVVMRRWVVKEGAFVVINLAGDVTWPPKLMFRALALHRDQSEWFREALQGLFTVLARAPAECFSRKFLCFCFSRSLKAIKRGSASFRLSFTVVYIIKMILVTKLRLHEWRRSPVIIWLCLWFISICFREISQNVHNLWNLSCRSFKGWKK